MKNKNKLFKHIPKVKSALNKWEPNFPPIHKPKTIAMDGELWIFDDEIKNYVKVHDCLDNY